MDTRVIILMYIEKRIDKRREKERKGLMLFVSLILFIYLLITD